MIAAAYARYSSDNQREESIDAQIRAIRKLCDDRGYTLGEIYTDEARTATTDKRPGFQQAIADAEAKKFDILVIHKMDRFSRDRYDSAIYKRRLKKAGVQLISVTEPMLDGSPESGILESMLEGMSEYYSKNLAREVMKGMKENAFNTQFNGGIAPLGYNIVDKAYVINEVEAAAVRLIFAMYLDGKGYGKIIDELNIQGYKTKRGNSFGKNSIYEILYNERYTGVYIFNKAVKGNAHQLKSEEDIIKVEGGIPAIISKEDYEKVRDMKSKVRPAAFRATIPYLLSGKIYCGACGAAMIGKKSPNRQGGFYQYYVCGNRHQTRTCNAAFIRADKLEKLACDEINAAFFKGDGARDMAQKAYDLIQKQGVPDTASIDKQINELSRQINKFIEAIADGIRYSDIKSKYEAVQAQRDALLVERDKMLKKAPLSKLTFEQVHNYVLKKVDIKKISPDDRKKIIEAFVHRIDIDGDLVKITVNVGPTNGSGGRIRTNDTPGMNRML